MAREEPETLAASLRSASPTGLPARPRKPRRELIFPVRLTREEHQELIARAQDAGVRAATYLRNAALGSLPTPVSQVNVDLLHELSRVGNNLNQVARYCNIREGEEPSLGQLATAITDVLSVVKAIGTSLLEPRA